MKVIQDLNFKNTRSHNSAKKITDCKVLKLCTKIFNINHSCKVSTKLDKRF